MSRLKIAVIGAGVAGVTSAYLLQRRHDVTLYEKNDYIGGHTHTIIIDQGPDAGTPVDTGFIVLNDRTYPHFNELLRQLNVSTAPTDMSFSYFERASGRGFGTTGLDSLFADRRNLVSFSYWAFLWEVLRFCRIARRWFYQHRLHGLSLADFLQQVHISNAATRQFVIPMASAIWSAPGDTILKFPKKTFVRFYENHGLLSVLDAPRWYYIPGGSRTYVDAFLKRFGGNVKRRTHITGVSRFENKVTVEGVDGHREAFDRVVLATHADQAFRLLNDPSDDESRLLSVWRYSNNHTVLHTDIRQLPPNRRIWSSWNYIREPGEPERMAMTVTYDMNHLQQLDTRLQYCVTLNPVRAVDPQHVIREMAYTHPVYSFESINSQKELPNLNGRHNTYFCGSYFGYGFHEDAVTSALAVAAHFGIEL
jgi:predicted NAD/FAD-binding protein